MNTSTLEHVFKNIRYKLLDVNGKKYVYDTDRLVWSFIFPFFHWFIPHPVYQINESTYEKLKMPEEKKVSRTWMVFYAGGISVGLMRLVSMLLDPFNDLLPFRSALLFLFLFIVITIILRVYLRWLKYKQLTNHVKLESSSVVFIRMKPGNKRGYVLAVYCYLFSMVFSLLVGYAYFDSGNFFVGIIFIVFTLLFLLIHTTVTPIGTVTVTYVEDENRLS